MARLAPLSNSSILRLLNSPLMASKVLLFHCFLVAALASCIHGGGSQREYLFSDIQSLLPSSTCSSAKDLALSSGATRLSLVHLNGPCSPLGGGLGLSSGGGRHESLSHEQLLDLDQARVDTMQGRALAASEQRKRRPTNSSKIPAATGITIGTGNYVVTVGFGTPAKNQTVIFDTGSDVSWIQCEPCAVVCYDQRESIFDPSESATYSNISCTSAFCSELDVSGCSSGTCVYGVQYGDNSLTEGFLAEDTLTVAPGDAVPEFRFGCGEYNNGLFGQAAGLLGLGREKLSFVSQTYQKYGGVFSYCLPSTSSSAGYLSFGSGGGYRKAKIKFTPMLSQAAASTFYYLNLTGITVGRRRLDLPPSVYSIGGTIIDSGTVITRLPPTAYTALRSAFRKLMRGYKKAPALSILDTCYDFTGHSSVKIPAVVLRFGGGVKMNLDMSGILYAASLSQTCLAFAGNGADSDMVILGNVQQRKFNVVYDLSRKLIGFGSGGC